VLRERFANTADKFANTADLTWRCEFVYWFMQPWNSDLWHVATLLRKKSTRCRRFVFSISTEQSVRKRFTLLACLPRPKLPSLRQSDHAAQQGGYFISNQSSADALAVRWRVKPKPSQQVAFPFHSRTTALLVDSLFSNDCQPMPNKDVSCSTLTFQLIHAAILFFKIQAFACPKLEVGKLFRHEDTI